MPAKYRVAAQMFGFREYTKTLEDAAKTMKRVKKIGYDYCQVSGFGPMDMADLKRVCDDAGVTPTSRCRPSARTRRRSSRTAASSASPPAPSPGSRPPTRRPSPTGRRSSASSRATRSASRRRA